jgi:hypothetical protein
MGSAKLTLSHFHTMVLFPKLKNVHIYSNKGYFSNPFSNFIEINITNLTPNLTN